MATNLSQLITPLISELKIGRLASKRICNFSFPVRVGLWEYKRVMLYVYVLTLKTSNSNLQFHLISKKCKFDLITIKPTNLDCLLAIATSRSLTQEASATILYKVVNAAVS